VQIQNWRRQVRPKEGPPHAQRSPFEADLRQCGGDRCSVHRARWHEYHREQRDHPQSSQVKDSVLTGGDVKNSSLTGKDIKNHSLSPSDFNGSVAGPSGATGASGPGGAPGAAGPAGASGGPGANGAPAPPQVSITRTSPAPPILPQPPANPDQTLFSEVVKLPVAGNYRVFAFSEVASSCPPQPYDCTFRGGLFLDGEPLETPAGI
jgi:hypothetical protein